jgi:CRP-like cAMP-binding protein
VSVAAQLRHARDLCLLAPDLVESLAACGEAMRVPEGAPLLSEGRANDACFLLVEGEVELYLERPGRVIPLRAVEAGELFGHDAVIEQAAQRWSARARCASTLLRLERATLNAALRRRDPLAALLQERLAVSSVRQLRSATACMLDTPAEAPPPTPVPAAPRPDDADAYVARIAARMGVDPAELEVSVRADADLGPAWKRSGR